MVHLSRYNLFVKVSVVGKQVLLVNIFFVLPEHRFYVNLIPKLKGKAPWIAPVCSKALNETKTWHKGTKIFQKTITSQVFLLASRYFVTILNIALRH